MTNCVHACTVGGCPCATYVCGRIHRIPASEGEACGRPGCGHSFWAHQTTPVGVAPTLTTNPHPVNVNFPWGVYFRTCEAGCADRFDLGATSSPPGDDQVSCATCGHQLERHLSAGIRTTSTCDDNTLDKKQAKALEAELKLQATTVSSDPLVTKALDRFVRQPTEDNHIICSSVISLTCVANDGILTKKEVDPEEIVTKEATDEVCETAVNALLKAAGADQQLIKNGLLHHVHCRDAQSYYFLQAAVSNAQLA
eukprot:TRINITY_DN52999_c0_g1_i1.p1 TRINITY_DN52999_c0_g1~~TRINITY_DN52999_c0_g1_i1.p1  ORF type:complete len:254 (-),score=14.55 TRINITY_DN52999_c0_g1_i1:188-949(-)